ncbi:MAG: hypothetical protein LBS83_00025 [Holosporales bacterium]|nr:hypothetical protein [Holosporales bacterium]
MNNLMFKDSKGVFQIVRILLRTGEMQIPESGSYDDLTPLHKNISYKSLFTRIIFFKK